MTAFRAAFKAYRMHQVLLLPLAGTILLCH